MIKLNHTNYKGLISLFQNDRKNRAFRSHFWEMCAKVGVVDAIRCQGKLVKVIIITSCLPLTVLNIDTNTCWSGEN